MPHGNPMRVSIQDITPCSCGSDCGESTVILDVGGKVYSAFAFGFRHTAGSEVDLEVSADFGDTEWNEMFGRNNERKQALISTGEWSYEAFGKIISVAPVVADFGGLELVVGPFTHDNRVIGEYIFTVIDRLYVHS